MKITSLGLLKACTLSVALLGSAAIVAGLALPHAAYAKSGNGNGNGNGGGNGNGKGGGNGNGNGNGGKSTGGGSESSAGSTSDTGAAAAPDATAGKSKSKKKSALDALGLSASELGALNAAHANPNALKHAAPNSRVGRIAAYRDAVLAGEEMQADLDAKQAELDGMTPPDRPATEVGADLATARQSVTDKAAAVADLEQALADAGGTDAGIEADLATARDDLAAAEATEADLQAEYDDAAAYETLDAEVDALAQQVEEQPAVERGLLEAAANKPVTDAVEAAVKQLLGL